MNTCYLLLNHTINTPILSTIFVSLLIIRHFWQIKHHFFRFWWLLPHTSAFIVDGNGTSVGLRYWQTTQVGVVSGGFGSLFRVQQLVRVEFHLALYDCWDKRRGRGPFISLIIFRFVYFFAMNYLFLLSDNLRKLVVEATLRGLIII